VRLWQRLGGPLKRNQRRPDNSVQNHVDPNEQEGSRRQPPLQLRYWRRPSSLRRDLDRGGRRQGISRRDGAAVADAVAAADNLRMHDAKYAQHAVLGLKRN